MSEGWATPAPDARRELGGLVTIGVIALSVAAIWRARSRYRAVDVATRRRLAARHRHVTPSAADIHVA